MSTKAAIHVYLLEHCETGQPTVIGIFGTKEAAEAALRPLDKSFAYAIYELPLDTILTKGPALEDQQGIYEHWHYGTQTVEVIETDEEGRAEPAVWEDWFEWPE